MNAATVLFYVFGVMATLGGIALLLTRNVLYAAYSLMLTLLGVAGIFIVLSADFVGTTQILVYLGGVLVLVLFGVMLTNRMAGQKIISQTHNRLAGTTLGMMIFAGVIWAIFSIPWPQNESTSTSTEKIQPLGEALMTNYLLGFELIGILLFIVLVGASYIARLAGQTENSNTGQTLP